MRIINPAFAAGSHGAETDSDQTGELFDWKDVPIAIVSNAKPNARELLEGLKAELADYRSVDNVDYLYKDSAAQPAPEALIDRIAADYKVAILALAD